LASSHNIACISHFSNEICLIVGKSDSKSQRKIFGGTLAHPEEAHGTPVEKHCLK